MTVDPSTLRVVNYPHPALRRKAEAISPSPEVRAVALRMIELMHEHEGIGLAAPQVGLPWRLFVTFVPEGDGRHADIDLPTAEAQACVYINPVLSDPRGKLRSSEEGCLSLPDIRGAVHRPETITITAQSTDGRSFTRSGTGLLARCWQHENDHLDGVLIIDRMTQIYRLKNRSALRDLERSASESE